MCSNAEDGATALEHPEIRTKMNDLSMISNEDDEYLAMSLLHCPYGNDELPANAKDPSQFSQRCDASISGRKMMNDSH